VKAGQLLAVIDSTDAQSLYNAARAALNQANDAYSRYRPLHVSGNMAEIDWQKVIAERQKAQSAFEIAQKTLDNCRMSAPGSGFISGRRIEAGDTVAPGVAVMRLLSLESLYADISAPIEDARHIKVGTEALVRVGGMAAGDRETDDMRAEVAQVDVSADALTRTYRVRVRIGNPPAGLLPGMLCEVYVMEEGGAAASDELVIPPEALQLGADGGYYVYVIEGGADAEGVAGAARARRRQVTTGGFEDGGVVVIHGLAEGDRIVVAGAQKLDDGVLVNAR
jgi:RND family efflux transporter MFP subunit